MEGRTITTDETDEVTVWNTNNGDVAFFLKHEKQVLHCCVSDKAEKLVSSDRSGVHYVWSLATGENLIKIQGPEVRHCGSGQQ